RFESIPFPTRRSSDLFHFEQASEYDCICFYEQPWCVSHPMSYPEDWKWKTEYASLVVPGQRVPINLKSLLRWLFECRSPYRNLRSEEHTSELQSREKL